jgi:hypothetical protein
MVRKRGKMDVGRGARFLMRAPLIASRPYSIAFAASNAPEPSVSTRLRGQFHAARSPISIAKIFNHIFRIGDKAGAFALFPIHAFGTIVLTSPTGRRESSVLIDVDPVLGRSFSEKQQSSPSPT